MSLMNRKGVLITCDIPTMQVIKFMDKQEGGKMIIKELDERNVFIHKTFSTSLVPCLLLMMCFGVAGAHASPLSLPKTCVLLAVHSIRTRMQQMQTDNHYER